MIHSDERSEPGPTTPTVDPQVLTEFPNPFKRPFPSQRFNAEEWENWMQWDGALDSLSPQSISDQSSPGFQAGSASQGSTSPSEAESLPVLPLTPVYRIPSIDNEAKTPTQTSDSRKASNKKRKVNGTGEAREVRTRQPKGQKISHNVIEKRYRTNLNDKIARLRDSVPVLKTAFEASQKGVNKDGGDSASEESGSDDKGAATGLKFNKATVLTKATEYILQLERANAKLATENSTLRRRVKDSSSDVNAPKPLYFRADEANSTGSCLANQVKIEIEPAEAMQSPISPEHISGMIPVAAGFQRLRAEAADQPSYAPADPTPDSSSPLSPTTETEMPVSSPKETAANTELIDFDSVRGAIPLPEYMRRNRIPISQQQHYAPAHTSSRFDESTSDTFVFGDEEPPAWWPRNRASKLLLGSLAGLMIMEGLSANADSPHKPAPSRRKRHLLPDELYTESRGFRAQIRQRIIEFAHSPQGKKALPVIAFAAVLLGVFLLAMIYLSRNDPKARRRANSVSSNPERDDSNTLPHFAPGLEGTEKAEMSRYEVSAMAGVTSLPHLNLNCKIETRPLVPEALARLRGCWRILTQGEQAIRSPQPGTLNRPPVRS